MSTGFTERRGGMRYRHTWPGFLLLGSLVVLLVTLLTWGNHFLTPGPAGGMRRLLQVGTDAPPPPGAEPDARDLAVAAAGSGRSAFPASDMPDGVQPGMSIPGAGAAPTPAVPAAASPRFRYALDLGTFALDEEAERTEAQLNEAGFSTVRFRLQAPARLFAVNVRRPVGAAPLPGESARAGEVDGMVKVARALPLRSAVELAGRLRASGFDAQIVAEASTRGQLTLRHGAFTSREEAQSASRKVSALGVPNEVVRVEVTLTTQN